MPTAVDLFSGAGGLTLGLRAAGFDVIAAVEKDALAVRTYRDNIEGVAVESGDIREVSPARLLDAAGHGSVDLVAGCPPCQGFSAVRTLNGSRSVEDERNDLLFDFLRFVRELRPAAVMMENVPGLGDDARFSRFTEELRETGYSVEHRVLNAAEYGVPQRRRRLLVLAGIHGPIPFAPPSKDRTSVRQALDGLALAGSSGDPAHDAPEKRTDRVARVIRAIPPDGGSRSSLPKELLLECHSKTNGFSDVYGRMAWDKPAPTITAGFVNPSKGRFLHPTEHRTVSIREGSLLQGFPKTFRWPMEAGKYPVARMIGNALPPEFVRRQAVEVAAYLRSAASPPTVQTNGDSSCQTAKA